MTIFLPAAATENRVLLMAAIPELRAITSAAPVRDLTLFSRKVTVGFITRE